MKSINLDLHDKHLDLSSPKVMGILNVTPDSFYLHSRKQTESEIADRANEIVAEGGSIIDVGAFSTRPGFADVSEEEELRRMRYGLEIVRREQPDAILSIDTFRPSVAKMAVEEYNADVINDVSEGRGYYRNEANGIVCSAPGKAYSETAHDFETLASPILKEVARLHVSYILMSLQPDFESTVSVFKEKLDVLNALGVKNIIIDPGYGFGKDVIEGNFSLLAHQQELKNKFSLPLLVGISRKRMIWQLLDTNAEGALNGTTAVNILALERGGDILRVHDVKAAVEAVRVYSMLCHLEK